MAVVFYGSHQRGGGVLIDNYDYFYSKFGPLPAAGSLDWRRRAGGPLMGLVSGRSAEASLRGCCPTARSAQPLGCHIGTALTFLILSLLLLAIGATSLPLRLGSYPGVMIIGIACNQSDQFAT